MSAVDEDVVDAREIDKVLTEVAAIGGRWSLFRKFLYDRLKASTTYYHAQIKGADSEAYAG